MKQFSSLVRVASRDMGAGRTWRWRTAWRQALYGEHGFAVAPGNLPRGHFSTAAEDPTMAELVAAELTRVARRLDRQSPGNVDLVDAGAGGGELLAGVLAAAEPTLVARTRATAIDFRAAPDGYLASFGDVPVAGGTASSAGRRAERGPATVRWRRGDASVECPPTRGLIVAHELLDDVPCDVAVLRHEGWRYLAVDLAGDEVVDGPVEPSDARWLQRWAGDARLADRVEIGRPRDEIAVALASHLTCGRLIIIDYATSADQRRRLHPDGTLTGYRNGHQCRPRPDGTMNLTAHVAIDSVVEALSSVGHVRLGTVADAADRHLVESHGSSAGPDGGHGPPVLPFAERMRWARVRDRGSWGGFAWLSLDRWDTGGT